MSTGTADASGRCRVAGALLAGGQSRRMGRPKALLPLAGEAMAARPARALDAAVGDWCVFGGDRAALEFLGRPLVPDRYPGSGPLEGLLSALRYFPSRPVLLLACDLPFVTSQHLQLILDRARSEPQRPSIQAVIAVDGEDVQPLCGWYAPDCGPALESALASGQRSVMAFVRTLRTARVDLSDGEGAGCLSNVNSPEEYEQASARLASAPARAGGTA